MGSIFEQIFSGLFWSSLDAPKRSNLLGCFRFQQLAMGLFLLRQCTEQFALQLRYSRDRPVSKMATLPIGAIATLDAFKKSASTI